MLRIGGPQVHEGLLADVRIGGILGKSHKVDTTHRGTLLAEVIRPLLLLLAVLVLHHVVGQLDLMRLKVLRNGSLILVGMSVSSEMSEILVAVAPKPAKPGLENVKFVGYVICQNIVQLGDAVEQNLTVLEEAEALVARSTAVLRSVRNAVDAERSWVYVKGALLVRRIRK